MSERGGNCKISAGFCEIYDLLYLLNFTEDESDELNLHVTRYRPEELAKLTKTTKFTRKEIQLIYRGFKQVCGFHSSFSVTRTITWEYFFLFMGKWGVKVLMSLCGSNIICNMLCVEKV